MEFGEAQDCLNDVQEFIFSIRKFFNKHPQVAKLYEKFLDEKEELIY